MNGPRRTPAHNPNADALVGLAVLAVVAVVVGAAWSAAKLAAVGEHTPKPPGNPVQFVADLVNGSSHWPGAATAWAIGKGAALAALVALVTMAEWHSQAKRVYVDRSGGRKTS